MSIERTYCFGIQKPIEQVECKCYACLDVELRILRELRGECKVQEANDAIIMLAKKAIREGCEVIWGSSENGRFTFHTDPPKYSA